MLMEQDEQAIALAILKRAEIARITRQLKTKLLKAKNKTESNSSKSGTFVKKAEVLPTPPASLEQITRKRSHNSTVQIDSHPGLSQSSEYQDDYETDEYESPTKKAQIPSSPLYTIGETLPSTPPRKHAILLSSSTSASQHNDILSTPKSKVINNRNLTNFKTPTSTTSHKILYPNRTPSNTLGSGGKKKAGSSSNAAELLMFFANSPSPASQLLPQSRKVLPTTPKRLFTAADSSIFNSTPPTSAGILAANALGSTPLGSTPLGSAQHSRTIDLFGNGSKLNNPVTPGKKNNAFLLNDFVTSVFTPSPRR